MTATDPLDGLEIDLTDHAATAARLEAFGPDVLINAWVVFCGVAASADAPAAPLLSPKITLPIMPGMSAGSFWPSASSTTSQSPRACQAALRMARL